MKILITGVCGFVGSTLVKALREEYSDLELAGVDNLSRTGSWLNRDALLRMGVKIIHGDIRNAGDVEGLPKVDWVIDAAANPSVLAGIDGKTSSRQLVEHNLAGTINLLEYCKRSQAGFVLLSTSRVYSIPPLAGLKMRLTALGADGGEAWRCGPMLTPEPEQVFPVGISLNGVSERTSTEPPTSLYGSTKVCSEHLALEYGATFNFPVWINRCGVLAGAGQFGHPAQGIFAYWVHSYHERRPLKFIGFGGLGYQVRDALHPRDLLPVLKAQFAEPLNTPKPRTVNFGGGNDNSMSLAQLHTWCARRFGENSPASSFAETRAFDIPWMVMDTALVRSVWDWKPQRTLPDILEEIAAFAEAHPKFLECCMG
ncbi:MAG: NAD-dependent epimerase/dehydratase family protein [Verrucomicrobiota bacterium]|nr:NAD-dependent epimerase/dehydratase family protein [Verrucomicrobiota bacterium]